MDDSTLISGWDDHESLDILRSDMMVLKKKIKESCIDIKLQGLPKSGREAKSGSPDH